MFELSDVASLLFCAVDVELMGNERCDLYNGEQRLVTPAAATSSPWPGTGSVNDHEPHPASQHQILGSASLMIRQIRLTYPNNMPYPARKTVHEPALRKIGMTPQHSYVAEAVWLTSIARRACHSGCDPTCRRSARLELHEFNGDLALGNMHHIPAIEPKK